MWGGHSGPCATALGRAVGVVGEVVEDGVPESRISDPIVPTLRGGLAHRQCAAASAAVVEDPLSGGEAQDERAVEAAGGLEVDVFGPGVETEPGMASRAMTP